MTPLSQIKVRGWSWRIPNQTPPFPPDFNGGSPATIIFPKPRHTKKDEGMRFHHPSGDPSRDSAEKLD